MNKIFLFLVVGLLFALSAGQTSAFPSVGVSSTSGPLLKQRLEQAKDKLSTSSQIMKGELGLKRDLVKEKANNFGIRLTSSVTNLEKLLNQVKARIVHLESLGKDVSNAKAKLPEAEQAVNTAKTSVENLNVNLPELAASSTPGQRWQVLKDKSQTTIQSIKTAHQKIVEVIRSLKPGRPLDPEADKATSTATPSAN